MMLQAAHDHQNRSSAAAAARAKRLKNAIANPPPRLTTFQKRLWVAYCEHESEADVSQGSGGLDRRQFDAALSAVNLEERDSPSAS